MPASPFEGHLVRLRARELDDEPRFHRWIHDPAVTEHLAVRYPLSHAAERDWLALTGSPSFAGAGFAVETLDGGVHIGSIALRFTSPENRSADLGITIGETAYWDGGYGSDAMRTVCCFGFEMMNLHRIELDVYEANARARHVYEKLGFRTEAIRRDALFKHGRYQDVIVMALLRADWADAAM